MAALMLFVVASITASRIPPGFEFVTEGFAKIYYGRYEGEFYEAMKYLLMMNYCLF